MSKFKKICKATMSFFLQLTAVILINAIGFMIAMRLEVFPNLQEKLVTSVMVTFSHQYLAKLVASDSRISKVMENNKVVDTNEVTDKSAIQITGDTVPTMADPADSKSTSNLDKSKDKIDLIDIVGTNFKGHMFIISNPKRVKLAVCKNLGSSGNKLNDLINAENGIGGVNAGGFTDEGGHGNGGQPTGIIVKNGEIAWRDKSVNTYNIIGFDKDGILILGNYNLNQIKVLNIIDAVSFGPYLIVNDIPTKIIGDGGWGYNPRTVIGQKADGTILLLEIDGRQPTYSIGATIRDIQNIMINYGAVNAANLDGGSSTVMYYNNTLINKPCSPFGQRPLPDAWIITQ